MRAVADLVVEEEAEKQHVAPVHGEAKLEVCGVDLSRLPKSLGCAPATNTAATNAALHHLPTYISFVGTRTLRLKECVLVHIQ